MPDTDYKRCSKCGECKVLGEFHRNRGTSDGRQRWCKLCAGVASRTWAQANPEKMRDAERRWRKANPEKARAKHRRWRKANPEYRKRDRKRQAERNPTKVKARQALGRAVREGRLAKPECCECCGDKFEASHLHGHHADYSKPLEVEWLCRECHSRRHPS